MKFSFPVCLLLLLCASARAEDGVFKFYGYAYDLETNRYAYTEVEEQRRVNGRWVGGTTHYYTPDGKEFGRKTLDFAADSFVPLYRLEFSQPPYAEGITANGEDIVMTRQAQGNPETGSVKKDGLTVADAGLAQLLGAHFDELLRGETLKFRVAAASRLDAYKFRAHRIADTTFENQPALQVQVDMDSLLKMFAGPLTFVFDAASRKLVEFRGITDVINPATGKAWTVRLSYPSARPKDAPALPP